MRVGIFILLSFFSVSSLYGQIFINEIDYLSSNSGVELAGPAGQDLNGWYMEFRDNNNTLVHTETVNGPTPIDNEASSGKGGIWFPIAGLQNQADRTIILYDDNNTPQDTVSYGTPFGAYSSSIIKTGLSGPVVLQVLASETAQNLQDGNNNIVWWELEPASRGDLNYTQLPVELITFEAAVNENVVHITWSTATEENNSHFDIERSSDGVTYERIGTIDGNGTTFDQQDYEFEDKNVQTGRHYYRLKQVDYDGQFEYSGVLTVDFSAEISVAIAPNPITQNSKLNIRLTQFENVDFVIFDMTGKIVKTYFDIDENGIHINDLDSGIYIYQIRQAQQVLKTDKLVVID